MQRTRHSFMTPKLERESETLQAFSVVDKTCGQAYCHSGHLQKDRNHIERVKKSMMGNACRNDFWVTLSMGCARPYEKQAMVFISVEDKDGGIPSR